MTWTVPSDDAIFEAVDATWPAAEMFTRDFWTLRRGLGGGKRASAASADQFSGSSNISVAEVEMELMGQDAVFMLRGDQTEFDTALEGSGYRILDPVTILACSCEKISEYDFGGLHAIPCESALPILAEIWAEGGVGPERLHVMARVVGPKTFLLGRHDNHARAAAFAACHNGIAMVHAVEVQASARRNGIARNIMGTAGRWAKENGATSMVVLTTKDNAGALNLYRGMGMTDVAHYHYRIK